MLNEMLDFFKSNKLGNKLGFFLNFEISIYIFEIFIQKEDILINKKKWK